MSNRHDDMLPKELPAHMTDAVRDALGVMVFHTGPIAVALRADGAKIPPKIEEEQAHVLWWFLHLALKHGVRYREIVGHELKRIAQEAREKQEKKDD